MVDSVVVIISTYNGSRNIKRQLDSIFAQKGVQVSVFIRDDHSTDDTVDIIEEYRDRKQCALTVIRGTNEGYARSFWDALRLAPEADYYAFSDQDDVWDPDKLRKCIQAMTKDSDIPQLAYCSMTRTDPNLIPLKEQITVLKPEHLSKKLVLTQTFNYGAATVLNASARDLICRHFPQNGDVPHDAWAGLLCYWFGKVFFVDESLYCWIRYASSVTGEGTRKSGILYRIRETVNGKTYPNVSGDLLEYYSDLIKEEDYRFLCKMKNYKYSPRDKLSLLFDLSFKRSKLPGSIILKIGILANWF